MTDSTLLKMISELQNYKGHTKEELMLKMVNERLNQSFEVYNKELEQSLRYLSKKNELRMMRKLNKL